MKLKYIIIPKREYWEGDELRPGDNVRSDVFKHFYIRKEDYTIYSQARTFRQIFEEVIREELNMSWGQYACEVLEGAEDGNPDLIELDKRLTREAKSRIVDVLEFECEAQYPLGTPVPEGYVEFPGPGKLYLCKEVYNESR
jgi:hypothetical protein